MVMMVSSCPDVKVKIQIRTNRGSQHLIKHIIGCYHPCLIREALTKKLEQGFEWTQHAWRNVLNLLWSLYGLDDVN